MILVTGASGFIGKYILNELLENGYEVRALTRRKDFKYEDVEIAIGDITKPASLEKAFDGIDAIFHNAAFASDYGKKKEFFKHNVEGTKNVAEMARKKGINRIIYTSSAGVYGHPNVKEEINEDYPKKPMNAYQKSKLMGEEMLKQYDFHLSIVRPPLVLGAGAKATKILLGRAEKGNLVYIGNGENFISIVHPKDVAKCLRLAFEKDEKGDVFNVVSFHCKIKELYEKIADKMGVDKPKKHVPYFMAYLIATFSEIFSKEPSLTRFRVKSFGTNRIISWEKARKKLGYKPDYDLKKTVKDMVEWYKSLKK
ncbi:MAG TPA: NAD-dependent epimerase/dehydratase family protein [Thermoplasmatales archaeon]|nr:NAD-dependent epimerase/dehydratase family protein [Thermoplasmatales archaeon]